MKTIIAILLLILGLLSYSGTIGSSAIASSWTEYPESGATRVDRDLYPFHAGDVNQFGDDEAYNSVSGKIDTGVRYPIHREDP